MNAPKAKFLKLLAGGCGLMILMFALAFGGMAWSVFRGYRRAADSREILEQTRETQRDFTPAPDGRVAGERMRRFLAVRRALVPFCEKASVHQRAFHRMAAYSEMESPPAKEFLTDIGRAAKSFVYIGSDFGDFVLARNDALIENEMGLGEYSWIYVTAYFSWLGNRPVRILERESGPRVFEERVFPEVRGMIERHLADLEDGPSAAAWRTELEALSADPERIPFEDGLPPEFEASLRPFRDELEELSCPEACELEVVLTEKVGWGYDHR
jgi:hypothetical protein